MELGGVGLGLNLCSTPRDFKFVNPYEPVSSHIKWSDDKIVI